MTTLPSQSFRIETGTDIEELEGEDDEVTTSLIAELEKLELSSTEARIFLFLSKTGPCSASDIARGTKVPRTDSYRHIGSLLARGLLTSTFTKPQKYIALTFEEAIDLLVKTKYEALSSILQRKKELQDRLTSISRVNPKQEMSSEFQVLEDKEVIHSKIKKKLSEVEYKLFARISKKTLVNFYYAGILEDIISLKNQNVDVRLKTSWQGIYEYLKTIHLDDKIGKLTTATDDALDFDFIVIDNDKVIILLYEEADKKFRGIYINSDKISPGFVLLFQRLQ